MLIATLLALSAQSPFRPTPPDAPPPPAAAAPDKAPPRYGERLASGCVAKLPFARGKSFCTLDAYLAHLQALSAIDLPWWREIAPGVFEHTTTIPGAKGEVVTRGELLRRFGFSG